MTLGRIAARPACGPAATRPQALLLDEVRHFSLELSSLLEMRPRASAAETPELVADEIADHELDAIVRQRRSLLAAQGGATLVAFVLPNVAVLLYLLTGVAFITAPLLLARRSRRTTPAIQPQETHARHA